MDNLNIIIADENGEEIGSLQIPFDLDLDIGGENDYQLTTALSDWQKAGYKMGYQFFVPGTEYGGLIQNMQVQEGDDSAVFTGDTWRGMMMDKIIEPPAGQDYLTVSGDANTIIATLLEGRFGSLITAVPSESGINVVNYQFDRYISLLDGIMKMLATKNARLKIKYVQGEPGGVGHVEVGAVEIQDLSETDEYSQDTKVRFTTTEVNNGINHLICLGSGELKDRQVVHLYADADGNISQTKTFTGLDERTATYDYSNAESIDELIKGGTDRLKELISYQSFEMQIDQTVADIGDIVGGREYTTGFVIKQQITQKILTANNGGWSVEFKVGGIVKQSSGVGGGGVTVNVIDDDNVSENTTFSSSKIKSDFLSLEKDLYTQIPKNADLNDYQTKGCYKCLDSTYTSTLKNLPKGLKWGFKLTVEEITYDSYICQKITENVTGNTFIRTLEGSYGWHDWVTRGLMSVFNTFSQIGITTLPCTTLDVFAALPLNSIAIIGTDTRAGISDLPASSGTLEITKVSWLRYKIAFYKSSGGDMPAIKGMWLATTNTDHSQLTWKKFYSEEDVANNGTTTVPGKILDARFGKTLLDKFSGYIPDTGGDISGDLNVGGWLQAGDLRADSVWLITDAGNALLSDVNENNKVISVGYGASQNLYRLGINGYTIELTPSDNNKIFGITLQAYKEGTNNKRTIFRSATNGGAYLGSASYCWNTAFFTNAITQSDRKAKDNVADIDEEKAKTFIMALKPSSYTLKNSDSDNPRTHLGLIAQDVAKAAKDTDMGDLSLYQAAVITDKKDGDEAQYSEDIPDEKLAWGLNYNELIAPLIKVVQAQQKQIDTLLTEMNKE